MLEFDAFSPPSVRLQFFFSNHLSRHFQIPSSKCPLHVKNATFFGIALCVSACHYAKRLVQKKLAGHLHTGIYAIVQNDVQVLGDILSKSIITVQYIMDYCGQFPV
jgi:hypothetical protein